MIRSIHPFPARMAPELAIAELADIPPKSLVLDPMAGSGTVLRHASEFGHYGLGFDMDPLAVLMTKVFTTPVDDRRLARLMDKVRKEIASTSSEDCHLPWIDDDAETHRFVNFWFAEPQLSDLRRISYVLFRLGQSRMIPATRVAVDVLKVALSRIIITKNKGASLARDVSHSRPHKVIDVSDFDVLSAFERSVSKMRVLLASVPPPGNVQMNLGDARSLNSVNNDSVDVVLTSPPYLNAIDYMRGHKLALVWLGHRLSSLKTIRSNSIGAERGPDNKDSSALFGEIRNAMCKGHHSLLPKHSSMIARYSEDTYRLMSEIARVLKHEGRAVLVIGNSNLKGNFICNSDGFICAGAMVGLRVTGQVERELPMQKRYLPLPSLSGNPLGGRMRTELIVSFLKE